MTQNTPYKQEKKMRPSKAVFIALALVAGIGSAPVALSDLDPETFNVSYRKTVFTVLGGNFGPMLSMIKGEIPWDDDKFESLANDLATVAQLDIARAFPSPNDPGKTRARPAIWENMDDFLLKLEALRTESAKLAEVADAGDKAAIMAQFRATGETCGNCHDDYKSKDYL